MNKDKIIEARNRTYDIYRRFAQKIREFDSALLKVEIHYERANVRALGDCACLKYNNLNIGQIMAEVDAKTQEHEMFC